MKKFLNYFAVALVVSVLAGCSASNSVEKTKEVGSQAWEKTKNVSSKAWEKTKDTSSSVWDKTKKAVKDATK